MPRKKKPQRHDYRDNGRFAKRPQINPYQMAVQQQAWLAGAQPGWWISDHMEELRHFVSWIYVGVHKIAQQWAQATVNVYDQSKEEMFGSTALAKMYAGKPHVLALARHLGQRRMRFKSVEQPQEQQTPIADHPAALLLDEPNPYTSGRIFRYQVACQMRLTGGCYIWEVPNQFGEPEHLWVIPRGWCRPYAPTGMYPGGYFQITPVFNTFTQSIVSPSQTTYNIPVEQMITVGYPSPLYQGEFTSPLSACSRIIDIMEQTDVATWSSFVNAVKPSLVFNIDPRSGITPTQEQIDRFQDELAAFKAGSNNAGKILMMLGLTVQQLMNGPTELDYVNGRQQNRDNVLAMQGVSPVAVGVTGATNYSEAAVQVKTMVSMSVAPDLDVFGDKLTKRWCALGLPDWGDSFEVCLEPEHFDDPTLDADMRKDVAAGFTAGVISPNEYRAVLKHPPLDDPIAEIPAVLLQSMMAPVEGAGENDFGGDDPYAAFAGDGLDLGDDLADDEDTGMKRPDLAGAPGRQKRFSLNGFSKNGAH